LQVGASLASSGELDGPIALARLAEGLDCIEARGQPGRRVDAPGVGVDLDRAVEAGAAEDYQRLGDRLVLVPLEFESEGGAASAELGAST
jgi:hypothetical protein